MVPSIINLFSWQKSISLLPLLLITTKPLFPIVDLFPLLFVSTFALRSPNMRSTSWTFFLKFLIKGVLVFLLFVLCWWVADYNSQFGIFQMVYRYLSIEVYRRMASSLSHTSLVFCRVLRLNRCCAANHFFPSIESDDQWQVFESHFLSILFHMCLVIGWCTCPFPLGLEPIFLSGRGCRHSSIQFYILL